MTKQVIRDYFLAFHIGNLKEAYKNDNWWIFIYLPLMTCTWFRDEGRGHIYSQYAVMLPIVFALFQTPLFRLRLPKIMFLCPVDAAGRREYLVKQYWLKITVPVFLSLLAVITSMLWDKMSGFTAACTLAETLMFTLGISIRSGIYAPGSLTDRRAGIDMPKKYEPLSVCEVLECIIGMLLMFVLMTMAGYGENFSTLEGWERVLILFSMVFIQLPITIKIMTYLKPALADAMDYETEYLR
jgi:hypothetical protein